MIFFLSVAVIIVFQIVCYRVCVAEFSDVVIVAGVIVGYPYRSFGCGVPECLFYLLVQVIAPVGFRFCHCPCFYIQGSIAFQQINASHIQKHIEAVPLSYQIGLLSHHFLNTLYRYRTCIETLDTLYG